MNHPALLDGDIPRVANQRPRLVVAVLDDAAADDERVARTLLVGVDPDDSAGFDGEYPRPHLAALHRPKFFPQSDGAQRGDGGDAAAGPRARESRDGYHVLFGRSGRGISPRDGLDVVWPTRNVDEMCACIAAREQRNECEEHVPRGGHSKMLHGHYRPSWDTSRGLHER